ncbi:TlpA family protein disulfide reductase [Dyadobacter sp. MSC1_007]|jgi:thiol-disulfide isomerase/thioredoxin|uniref:TlpA family protein disulfide reductase n=1 Tax=Dyadobacter sp. MSC1_007 TaxID=2909264 RepID=UPI00202FA4F3|nr:TlpA disulfide reductase family protein [Dyadobacter sp. MSC1_007]
MTREPIHYIASRGDTINFKFVSGIPYAVNKSKLTDDGLNYEADRILSMGGAKYNTPYDIYTNVYLGVTRMEDVIYENKIKSDLYYFARDSLKSELDLLKSLNYNKSKTVNLLANKLTYQIATMDLEQHRLGASKINDIFKNEEVAAGGQPYTHFLAFMEKVSDSIHVASSRIIRYKNGAKVDYREVYDRASKWKQIDDIYRKHLLFKYLRQIGDNFSILDLQKYLLKFESAYGDTLLSNRIRREFPISEYNAPIDRNSLVLLNHRGSKSSFSDFLKSNAGKIIYVDFWASWCAPCRTALPASAKLRNKLASKKIIFIYLSLDKNFMAWKNACEKENLSTYSYSYLIANGADSDFLKRQQVLAIPRYMIYDETGRLIYANAPTVESEEIESILTQLAEAVK